MSRERGIAGCRCLPPFIPRMFQTKSRLNRQLPEPGVSFHISGIDIFFIGETLGKIIITNPCILFTVCIQGIVIYGNIRRFCSQVQYPVIFERKFQIYLSGVQMNVSFDISPQRILSFSLIAQVPERIIDKLILIRMNVQIVERSIQHFAGRIKPVRQRYPAGKVSSMPVIQV